MRKVNTFELSNKIYAFGLENSEKIKPLHYALYFYMINLNNSLGWVKTFSVPTYATMEATGIRSYKTYSATFHDLIEFGFITLVEKAKNQHTANKISLNFAYVQNTEALSNTLFTARSKQEQEQVCSNSDSTVAINKLPNNITNKLKNFIGTVENKNDWDIVFYEKSKFKNPFSENIIKHWEDFKKYKKKVHKFQYANVESENRMLKELFNLSKENEETAIQIIQQSMDNGWKGFFEVSQKSATWSRNDKKFSSSSSKKVERPLDGGSLIDF